MVPKITLLPRSRYRSYSSSNKEPSESKEEEEDRRRRSTLSLVQGLLFGQQHQASPPSTSKSKLPEKPPIESTQAEFVTEVRKYGRETPFDQYTSSQRKRLGAWRDETTSASAGDWLFGGGRKEIAFTERHRVRLNPPHQQEERNQKRRKFDFVRHRMKCWIQVLTTPTADTSGTTLLLHFDNKRYLIGSIGEGTQRACVEIGTRLQKISDCFITGRTEWRNTGGLIGMILTLADAATSSQQSSLEDALAKAKTKARRTGVSEDPKKVRELEDEAKDSATKNSTLSLFAPPNLNHTLATARRFVFRKGMPVNVHEILDDKLRQEGEDQSAPYYADENIKVWPLSVRPSTTADNTMSNGTGTVSPRKRSIDEVYSEEATASNGKTAIAVPNNLTQEERDKLTVKAVVAEMFNSSWRLDTLYETPLSEVKLPATIFVRNPETKKIEKYHGPLPDGRSQLSDPNLPVLVRRPWPGALVESLPPTQPAKEAISYIIRNHIVRGKFNKARAQELKVEMGRKWQQLQAGNSVLNVDGETITSEMVLGESKEGGGIAIVDVPDPSYIDNLTNRPEWRDPKVMSGVGFMFWICGKGVAIDSRVHAFMTSMSNVEHVVSSPDYSPNHLGFEAAAASTVKLRKVDPSRYRVPVHDVTLPGSSQDFGGHASYAAIKEKHPLPQHGVRLAEKGIVLQLEPAIETKLESVVQPLSIAKVEEEISPDILDEAAKSQQAVDADEESESAWAADLPNKDAEIITLGTGSALPSKYRNVSATLLRVPGWGNVLLDCGENTLGQLKRVFTADELKQVLQELKLIFISHMHADHHLGTVSVIKAWYEEVHGARSAPPPASDTDAQSLLTEDQRRLAIISEPAMLAWLHEYSAVEDYGFSRIAPLNHSAGSVRHVRSNLGWFISPTELAELSEAERTERRSRLHVPASLIGLQSVEAADVSHCHGARAVSITFPSGFKASYSGDCRPSKLFSKIGKGSTVCIHEATFDDDLQVEAEAKRHSTTSEALGVAQAMGAKACVLTHFSQRYQKLPILEHSWNTDSERDPSNDLPRLDVEEDHEAEADDTTENQGPLEDNDTAPTFPDQQTSNDQTGQQYDIPSKKDQSHNHEPPSTCDNAPEAVKFKLTSDMRVCVAFDYMRVKVGEIGQMEKFTPALLKLFAEEDKKNTVDVFTAVKGGGEGRKGKKGKGRQG